MRLIVVSGLSGSGKSVALHMLEDLGYYCVDNIPAALLKPLISHILRGSEDAYPRTAVGLDARNRPQEIEMIPAMLDELRRSGIHCDILYLHAVDEVLLKRYAETRRKHPLTAAGVSLREAIAAERTLLEPITSAADLIIDTSTMGVHALREAVRARVDARRANQLSLMFESFGYKHGIPGDADFVFDVRSLPNPYWEHALRDLTGQDPAVIAYLEGHAEVGALIADLTAFISRRVAESAASNRGYLTIAVGCTGGQHRSVYVVERLAAIFGKDHPQVLSRHDALRTARRRTDA
ncbi:MAG: RNase adapter RapZ [Gammaproteobacteria bacterium]|nr:RNase adapter RapZ [Gammaproteobacteria bacterium]MDE2347074.1 RNase adapter RapZ [Gammaproteobacteria bacterium]